MRLLISQYFFLTLITVSFISSIMLQYLPPLFFSFLLFLFHLLFLNLLAPIHLYTFNNLATMFNSISLQYPHSTVWFHYNTPYRKYLLNCKQRFKTRKEMIRENCYNPFIKKHFSISKFLPYLDTTSISLVGISSQ